MTDELPPPGGSPPARRGGLLRELGSLTVSTYRLTQSLSPLLKQLGTDRDTTREELSASIDVIFDALYRHPLLRSTEKITSYLRQRRLIPNEESTEELIRFVVAQGVARSPVQVRTRSSMSSGDSSTNCSRARSSRAWASCRST